MVKKSDSYTSGNHFPRETWYNSGIRVCSYKAMRTTVWDQQHEDSKGNTTPAALVKAYRVARERQSAKLQIEDPWHRKGWGTVHCAAHTFLMSKFRLKSSHILHAHKTGLPIPLVDWAPPFKDTH